MVSRCRSIARPLETDVRELPDPTNGWRRRESRRLVGVTCLLDDALRTNTARAHVGLGRTGGAAPHIELN